jgi:hypothetical protein
MTSDHEWMSNTGTDIDIKMGVVGGYARTFNYPLYAIDFVADYAVDLNRCPGLSHTGVDDILSPRECAELIIDYAQRFDFEGNPR